MTEGTLDLWSEQDRHPGDRTALFRAFDGTFDSGRVLYPGSWVDVAASFVFPDVVYVDTDRRARRFFADEDGVRRLVSKERSYPQDPSITFHPVDYEKEIPEEAASFGLLISLYAGFVSRACRRYLRPGGLLLANNSHGDAGMASLDPAFELVGVLLGGNGSYRVRTEDLGRYLKPRDGVPVTRQKLESTGRGVAYSAPAAAYVFRLASAPEPASG